MKYPEGVRKQIHLLLKYKGGREMVKRYLEILSSPQNLARSPKFCNARGSGGKRKKKKHYL